MLGTDISLTIAGNKIDLESERHVSSEVAEEWESSPNFKCYLKYSWLNASFCRYARSVGAKHHHTSAKLNRGIEEMFLDLTQQMIAKADEKPKTNSRNGGNITIVDDSQANAKHKSGKYR